MISLGSGMKPWLESSGEKDYSKVIAEEKLQAEKERPVISHEVQVLKKLQMFTFGCCE